MSEDSPLRALTEAAKARASLFKYPPPKPSYREMSKLERAKLDAFYGGISVALSIVLYREGVSTQYREVMGAVDAREFYLWCRRNDDIELPRVREYLRWEAKQHDRH